MKIQVIWNDCESLRQRHELSDAPGKDLEVNLGMLIQSTYLKILKVSILLNLRWLNSIKKEVGQL